MLGVRTLQLNRRGDCIACAGEREEERVALGVDLDPLVPLERVADELAMIGDQLGIVLAEPLEQTGGALDVGEDECDGPCGKHGHGAHFDSRRGEAFDDDVGTPLLIHCARGRRVNNGVRLH
jgi:hypothetical protein